MVNAEPPFVHKTPCVQLPTPADDMTLLAFAADRRAATRRATEDLDRKAAVPAADVPCSN